MKWTPGNTSQDIEDRRGDGAQYRHAKLVLFGDAAESGCGELDRRFGAPGDFAQAYVLAHEIGHHVQKLLGIEDKVRGLPAQVTMELQADCLAGVLGQATEPMGILQAGDVEEGIGAAKAHPRLFRATGSVVQSRAQVGKG